MKSIIVRISIFTFIWTLTCFHDLFAQDKITLTSGEIKEGKVTGISETIVKLRYPGEDFDYELDKRNVAKIQFASGRVDNFATNTSAGSNNQGADLPKGGPDSHNKIAVLPFTFITNEPGMSTESMGNLTQNSTANFVKKEYGELTLQDPMVTNSIFGKNNVNRENIASFSPSEIAQMLGVEFLIYGTVNIINKGSSTYNSAVGTYKEKESKNYQSNSDNRKTTGVAVSTGSSTTTVNYDTTVDFRLFNDRGDNLYSESRHAFGTSIDAYKGSIEYMARRTPFGSKYGKK
jgi:hypothetical protein